MLFDVIFVVDHPFSASRQLLGSRSLAAFKDRVWLFDVCFWGNLTVPRCWKRVFHKAAAVKLLEGGRWAVPHPAP